MLLYCYFVVQCFRVCLKISNIDYSIALRGVCYFHYSLKPEEMSLFSKLDPSKCCLKLFYSPKVVLLLWWCVNSSHQLGETLSKGWLPSYETHLICITPSMVSEVIYLRIILAFWNCWWWWSVLNYSMLIQAQLSREARQLVVLAFVHKFLMKCLLHDWWTINTYWILGG